MVNLIFTRFTSVRDRVR